MTDEGDFMIGSHRKRISGGEMMMGSRATSGEVGQQDLVDRESLVSAFGGSNRRREQPVRRPRRSDEEEPYEEERYEEEPRNLLEM
jgi:hypothetical protein